MTIIKKGFGSPQNIITKGYTLAMLGGATLLAFTAYPTYLTIGVTSTVFTVSANGSLVSSVTVTPSFSGLSGTISPATLTLTPVSTSGSFTFTPSTSGFGTLTLVNTGTLGNPMGLSIFVQGTNVEVSGLYIPSSVFLDVFSQGI